MKAIFKVNLMVLAIVFCCTACNNDNGSSVPKGDPAIVHGSDSSSQTPPTSGSATGTTNNANLPSPGAATPDSVRSGKDSTTMKKP